jgi:hypothetical protein
MNCHFTLILELIRESPFLLSPEQEMLGIEEADDRLYCWVLELFEFPEAKLKEDMKKYGVKSLV